MTHNMHREKNIECSVNYEDKSPTEGITKKICHPTKCNTTNLCYATSFNAQIEFTMHEMKRNALTLMWKADDNLSEERKEEELWNFINIDTDGREILFWLYPVLRTSH